MERQCLDWLRLRRYRPERLHAGRFRSLDGRRFITGHAIGTPDYCVTHPLYPAFYLETKRTGGAPRPEQVQKHVELYLCGLACTTVDDLDDLRAWVEEHEQLARQKWAAALAEKS